MTQLTLKDIMEQADWYEQHLKTLKQDFERIEPSEFEIATVPYKELKPRFDKTIEILKEMADCDACLKDLQSRVYNILVTKILDALLNGEG